MVPRSRKARLRKCSAIRRSSRPISASRAVHRMQRASTRRPLSPLRRRTIEAGDEMALIELDAVHVFYDKIEALKGISLSVEEKRIVTLVGARSEERRVGKECR